jgi:raffinose/stachyose/melibiose transport system substrate-binding protein
MSRPRSAQRTTLTATVLMGSMLALAACSSPGGTAPTSTSASTSSATFAGGTPSCGTTPVSLSTYIETGFPTPNKLSEEFTKQYPNVTFNIREDQFAVITQNAPRVLVDDPPDLMRLPQVSELAKDGLLLNLDPYAKAFGWDKWPASQLEQMRVQANGRRGDGSLYAMGLNFSMTGVFYNKELAAKFGMTSAPTTLAELDADLKKAKEAGLTPAAQFNGGATGGLAFPLQGLMAAYGDASAINAWIFQKPGATIDTPTNLQAAEHLKSWIDAGYFASDINSIDYATMMSRFIDGKSVFIFNGDWESGNLDAKMAGNVGFFLMPPAAAGGKFGAMSAPLTYGISAKAKHPDCAAFFLNWVATNDKARMIDVQVGGSHPMGPADAFMPSIDASTVTAQTLAAGAQIGADNGAMDFIANATGAIYAKSWTPNLQKMDAGQLDAKGLLSAVQGDYQSEIGG